MRKLEVDKILEKNGWSKNKIVGILQDIQDSYSYLPEDILIYISEKLNIPLSQIYSISTFYRAFSLKPKGKYRIKVCLGTACHVRGGYMIAEFLKNKFGILPGETTEDGLFSFDTVNCLGACAIGPIVVINEKYYGQMDVRKTEKIIKGLENEKNKQF
ncbi:MAG: NAD(P)H-dependent oxidoreductase subunit E [candidate division WOR-3 bacterium]|nr:NAD(P)H-dependent oxidoreductase subunit E [Candidatus Omnitrophota bacterium]MCM8807448.1 NAD(P)H-dependent oxidoreductase subunit E [Candidatus Omnitrophota bacterium]